ncbi:MAG: serine hydrolase domain-containing protein, partial [Candidatus Shapirobacteria bacterium]
MLIQWSASMKSKVPLFAFMAAFLCLSTMAFSQSPGAPAIPEHLRQAVAIAREALEQDLRAETACSAAVAIIEDRAIVYSETFGLADRENKMPVGADTLFNIGSISKTFTASAVMALVDEGKVELDVPVLRYLPEFAMADPRFRNITVRML